MNRLLASLVLASAACATNALAANVGVTISLGEPGFYGQLDIDNGYRPRVINSKPVIITQRYRNLAPIYLRVPAAHQRQWSRYCDRYNACTRPVYFVRDDWYQKEYAPRYRQQHAYGRDDHRDDRSDRHDDGRNDHDGDRNDDHHDHDDRGPGHR